MKTNNKAELDVPHENKKKPGGTRKEETPHADTESYWAHDIPPESLPWPTRYGSPLTAHLVVALVAISTGQIHQRH